LALQIHAAAPLFAWPELEDSPSLRTTRAVLASLPDGPLLLALRQARGTGRDDYPLEALWGVVLLAVLCRHLCLNDCLAELHRNPSLCRLLGIRRVVDIPGPHNLSRFLDLRGRPGPLLALRGVFDALVGQLAGAVADLGRHTASDRSRMAGRRRSGSLASTHGPRPGGAPGGAGTPAGAGGAARGARPRSAASHSR
jgi:hypothetical protein